MTAVPRTLIHFLGCISACSAAALSSRRHEGSKAHSTAPETAVTNSTGLTLACLMIVRDESENLAKNVPLWGEDFFDAFVVAVDDRTSDGSTEVLESTIPPSVPRHVFNYTFRDFGSARTTVLREAHRLYPNVTHVFTVDPDWVPHAGTLNKSDLDMDVEAYRFKVWDRSRMSTRRVNWLARNVPGLSFAYYVHEDFRMPDGLPPRVVKDLGWEVSEVEPNVTWHNRVRHGDHRNASRSHRRYYFDLALLEREQADPRYADSAHTLFYLGIVHAALLEGMEGYRPPFLDPEFELTLAMRHHLDRHVSYLERLADLHLDSIYTEYVYLSLRWLAYAHQFLLLRSDEAKRLYRQCVDYDTGRVDCKVELSKLHTFAGRHGEAWDWAGEAMRTARPERAWTHTYMYDCVTPLQVSRAALNVMAVDDFGGYAPNRFALGYLSMKRAIGRCDTLVLEPDDIFQQLEGAYDVVWSRVNGASSFREEDGCIEVTSADDGRGEDAELLADAGMVHRHLYCDSQFP